MPDRTDGVPVQEAARRLGISVQAVRKRARRGSLTAYKENDIWYIVAPVAEDAVHVPGDAEGRAASTPPRTHSDAPGTTIDEDVVLALRDQLSFMQREVEKRDAEIEEMRRVHAEQVHELHGLLAQSGLRQLPATIIDAQEPTIRGRGESPPSTPTTSQRGAERADGLLKRILQVLRGETR